MKKSTDTALAITADYRQFIEELKVRVVSARISANNVWRMRQFFLAYSSAEFLGQPVPEIPSLGSRPSPPLFLGQLVPKIPAALSSADTAGNTIWDLLFYHRFLKALVAFDLKIGAFEPEHAGKMDFYLNLLNDKERGPGELKGKLPTAKQLADIVRGEMGGGE